jgi:hypothetical protein
VTVATDLGVPRSTARGWLGATATVVVCRSGIVIVVSMYFLGLSITNQVTVSTTS